LLASTDEFVHVNDKLPWVARDVEIVVIAPTGELIVTPDVKLVDCVIAALSV
jgi:hypothetical protein